MKRRHLTTAAALIGLGLLSGCASTTNTSCNEPREGFFTRMFGGMHRRGGGGECECVETGRITEGPIIADPGCCGTACGTPCCGGATVGTPVGAPTFGAAPFLGTAPTYTAPPVAPPAALPMPSPLAQPVPANPSSQVKDAGK